MFPLSHRQLPATPTKRFNLSTISNNLKVKPSPLEKNTKKKTNCKLTNSNNNLTSQKLKIDTGKPESK